MNAFGMGRVCAAALALWLGSGTASATELQLSAGVLGGGSAWRGDAAVAGHLQFGARFIDVLGPYARVEEGYASVDRRLTTLLSLGLQVWITVDEARPYLRVGLIHQHEEALGFVADEPASAMLGVGDGIRHRTGAELALGCEYPVYREDDFELFAGGDAFARLYPDPMGPLAYGGVSARFGFNYAL